MPDKEKHYPFPDGEAEVTLHTARVYHLRWPGQFGWVIFTICDATGELSIQSDWGDFHHRWNPHDTGAAKFSHFIAGWRDDLTAPPSDRRHYLMDKFGYRHSKDTASEFDGVATKKRLRLYVGEAFKEGQLATKDEVQELLAQIDHFVDEAENTNTDLALASAVDPELDEFFSGALYEYLETTKPFPWIICRDELLPRLFAVLRQDILREEHVLSGGL